jgi:tetratricopeptide (TPR) repeat protein
MSILLAAAFGDEPRLWPLPPATTSSELWLRAVAAGGQGHYGSAMADLDALCRLQPGGPLVSLAHSTRASFLRQLGWHDRARRWDGRALVLAGADPEAGADALIGLAADALGVGRFEVSAAALRRAEDLLAGQVPPRLPVRLAWVTAELAMARGDGQTAVPHAERAVGLAAALGSARHAVKSDVIRAAALCSAGDLAEARRVADVALENSERLGIIPLRWALACLLADIGSGRHPAVDVLRIRNECAATVRRRGGDLADR